MLIKIQPSKYSQIQDDSFHIRGSMCKILKHHKMGYDRDTFYKLALEKFPRWIDAESFDKAINDLIMELKSMFMCLNCAFNSEK